MKTSKTYFFTLPLSAA